LVGVATNGTPPPLPPAGTGGKPRARFGLEAPRDGTLPGGERPATPARPCAASFGHSRRVWK